MQIIIPMSGFGERFKKVGYKIPKPLIKINGIEMSPMQFESMSIPKIVAESPKYFRHICKLPPLLTPISKNFKFFFFLKELK